MRLKRGRISGKRLRIIVFDLLVIFSLLLNVWAITQSGQMEGKIDALGKELTTLNSTLDYRAGSACVSQMPTQVSTTLSDRDGDEAAK